MLDSWNSYSDTFIFNSRFLVISRIGIAGIFLRLERNVGSKIRVLSQMQGMNNTFYIVICKNHIHTFRYRGQPIVYHRWYCITCLPTQISSLYVTKKDEIQNNVTGMCWLILRTAKNDDSVSNVICLASFSGHCTCVCNIWSTFTDTTTR